MTDYSFIGKRIPKPDAIDKATGRVVYGHDVKLPGMLHGKILRSKYAHAKILNIDASKAENLPGVKAVITAKDTPMLKFGYGEDHLPLKAGKVRSFRDEIAAVAAVDEDVADEALDLIDVEYEELPTLFDPEAALRPDAMLIHEDKKSNLFKKWFFSHGDVQKGLDESDIVVEHTFKLPHVAHGCMETNVCVADFDLSGNLTLYSTTQIPFLLMNDLSKVTGIPGSKIKIVQAKIGGAFGVRLDMYPFEPIAVFLAQKAGKPVRISFTREEEFAASPTRQPVIAKTRLGGRKDGTIMARDVRLVCDNGAYVSWGSVTPLVMMQTVSSLYHVKNILFEALIVYTNNPYTGAVRGYGNPQATFIVETQMDDLAVKLGIDPLELRLLNANKPNETTPQGIKITTCGLAECLERAAEEISWEKNKEKKITSAGVRSISPLGETERPRGIGIASTFNVGGGARIYRSDGCGCMIKVDDFGKATIITGATDIGQGADVVQMQIVAEELGIPIENVRIVDHDTDVTLWDVGVHASRTTFIAGNAALLAARDAKSQILKLAAGILNEKIENMGTGGGFVYSKIDPNKRTPIDKVIRKGHFRSGGNVILGKAFYDPPNEMLGEDSHGNISSSYGFGVQAAEIEVDMETGRIKVLRIITAADIGKAINPMYVEGQIEGGISMGIGYALTEELIVEKGEILNPNLFDYKMLTSYDMPDMKTIIVETNDPLGPFGAKGVGEMGVCPTAPAIANAVYDAIGLRLTELPMTPERVLKAIQSKSRAKKGVEEHASANTIGAK